MIFRLIILSASTIFAFAPTAHAKPFPAQAQRYVDEVMSACRPSKVIFEKGFVKRDDVNGDGREDFIFNYENFGCADGKTTEYCGSGGCKIAVVASTKNNSYAVAYEAQAYSVRFLQVKDRYAMTAAIHGMYCGKPGAEPCSKILYWNGQKFDQNTSLDISRKLEHLTNNNSSTPRAVVSSRLEPASNIIKAHSKKSAKTYLRWNSEVNLKDQTVGVSYAEPGTDFVVISIQCKMRSGRISVYAGLKAENVKDGAQSTLELSSNVSSTYLPAKGYYNEMNERVELTAELDNHADITRLFLGTGVVFVGVPGSRAELPLNDQARAAVTILKEKCPLSVRLSPPAENQDQKTRPSQTTTTPQ
jgi:hypothetical protein